MPAKGDRPAITLAFLIETIPKTSGKRPFRAQDDPDCRPCRSDTSDDPELIRNNVETMERYPVADIPRVPEARLTPSLTRLFLRSLHPAAFQSRNYAV